MTASARVRTIKTRQAGRQRVKAAAGASPVELAERLGG